MYYFDKNKYPMPEVRKIYRKFDDSLLTQEEQNEFGAFIVEEDEEEFEVAVEPIDIWVDSPADIPAAGPRKKKKKRKKYGTLNIPDSTFDELRRWLYAFRAMDPDRKWTYETVLNEMMEALSKNNWEVRKKYEELSGPRKSRKKAALKKGAMKKKKPNLGYVILTTADEKKVRMKIYKGEIVYRSGKRYHLPEYCHVPMHVKPDPRYPFLQPGTNASVDKLLTYPGAKRENGKSPVTVGQVKVWMDGENKKLKIRRGQASNRDYVTMNRKRYSIEELKEMYKEHENRLNIIYDEQD